uniref:Uncharacterized protein n=1 Tax=Ditylenchus dipsaci TaxID=166011 RepID=A0A915DGI6_9BILA
MLIIAFSLSNYFACPVVSSILQGSCHGVAVEEAGAEVEAGRTARWLGCGRQGGWGGMNPWGGSGRRGGWGGGQQPGGWGGGRQGGWGGGQQVDGEDNKEDGAVSKEVGRSARSRCQQEAGEVVEGEAVADVEVEDVEVEAEDVEVVDVAEAEEMTNNYFLYFCLFRKINMS